MTLLYYLDNVLAAHPQQKPLAAAPLVSDVAYRELLHARHVLGDCYRRPVMLEDAAASIFLSPWHFQREFRRAFGETPHAYVTRLRLSRAQELLATTRLSILEICHDVGFSSVGSFTTLFSKRFGVSPGRYRRSCRSVMLVSGLRDLACIPFCFAKAFRRTVR